MKAHREEAASNLVTDFQVQIGGTCENIDEFEYQASGIMEENRGTLETTRNSAAFGHTFLCTCTLGPNKVVFDDGLKRVCLAHPQTGCNFKP